MSKHAYQQRVEQKQPEGDLESLRAEVATLRNAVGELAWLLMDPRLRNKCRCGAIACRTVTASSNQVSDGLGEFVTVKRDDFPLCESCALPDGWTQVRSVELAPPFRETVRLVNALRCLPQS